MSYGVFAGLTDLFAWYHHVSLLVLYIVILGESPFLCCAREHTHTHEHTHTRTHPNTHTHTHEDTHTQEHTHEHTRTHTRTHTVVRSGSRNSAPCVASTRASDLRKRHLRVDITRFVKIISIHVHQDALSENTPKHIKEIYAASYFAALL